MVRCFLTILVLVFVTAPVVYAQPVTGLWEVTSVQAGSHSITPTAKWTRINPDRTFQSGNGWRQNSEGTWSYDDKTARFLPKETNSIEEDYGPFTVSFQDSSMLWRREEDGMRVTVTWEKIDKLPMSPADMLVGLWDLIAATEKGENVISSYDPNNKYYIFIRWDGIYVERTSKGERQSGLWHMDAHKPELTLIGPDNKTETWGAEISASILKMIGISGANKNSMLEFKRINKFPE